MVLVVPVVVVVANVVVVAAVVAEAGMVFCDGIETAVAVGGMAVEVKAAVAMVVGFIKFASFVVPVAVMMVVATEDSLLAGAVVDAAVAKAAWAQGTLAAAVLVADVTATIYAVPFLWAATFDLHSSTGVCMLVPLSSAVASRVVFTSATSCFTESVVKPAVVSIGGVSVFVLDLLATALVLDMSTVVPATIEVTNSVA